jgi:hypothetical protein
MGLMAKASGGSGDFEPVPMGTHIARCVTVCDLGLQPSPWGLKEKVYFGFEVPGVRVSWKDKEGKEHEGAALIGTTYNLSIHKKAVLGQHLESWRGKTFTDEEKEGFDVLTVLGAPAMLSVTHNTTDDGKIYANIAAIIRVPKGTQVLDAETELVGYTAMDGKWSGNLDKLPEWLQKKATEGQRQSPKEPEAPPQSSGDDFDDDIPF